MANSGDEADAAGPGQYTEEVAGGGGDDPNKCAQACGCCCLGWLIFPLTLYLLGKNEQTYVCDSKNIDFARSTAATVSCTEDPKHDQFVFFSCAVDPSSYQDFNLKSLNDVSDAYGNRIKFKTMAVQQIVESRQCVENVREETTADNKKKKIYTYSLSWETLYKGTSHFKDKALARTSCNHFVDDNVRQPWLWTSTRKNPRVGSVKAGKYKLDSFLTSDIQPNVPVDLSSFMSNFPATPLGPAPVPPVAPVVPPTIPVIPTPAAPVAPSAPPGPAPVPPVAPVSLHSEPSVVPASSLRVLNQEIALPQGHNVSAQVRQLAQADLLATIVQSSGSWFLQTCDNAVGCLRVKWLQDTTKGVSVIANSGTGDGTVRGQPTPKSWGCPLDAFERMTKQSGITKEKMLTAAQDSRDSLLIVIRIIGVLGTWLAVFCCLNPIIAAVDIIGDYLDMIPCIGPFLKTIADVVESLVTMVVCCVACSFGCSSALLTVAIVWIFMRPFQGFVLICVCGGIYVGIYVLMSMVPKKEARLPTYQPNHMEMQQQQVQNPYGGQMPGAMPVAQAQAMAQPQPMVVQCPQGCGPGSQIQIQAPDGRMLVVTVPDGVYAGQPFQCMV